jgi:inner membrane protein
MLFLTRFGIIQDPNFLKIVLFSLIGHYVFDMISESGIPLFYPFKKNPCVMPGNPDYRFKTSCVRGELIIFAICGILCFSMQPLFAHGFWTAYNRQFSTIRHVDRENRNTAFYIICEYSYILNAELHEGEAIVIDSNTTELTLFDRQNVFTLSSDNPQLKINHTRPRLSTIEKRFEDIQFFGIDYDSLQTLLRGRLASGLIQSNRNVQYIENAVTFHTNFIRFSNRFDFHIVATVDTQRIATRAAIARLEAQIQQSRVRHQAEVTRWREFNNEVAAIQDTLRNHVLSHYDRNRLQQQLIRLRNRPVEEPVFTAPVAQIAELDVQRSALVDNPLTFSGHMTIFHFGFEDVEQTAENGITQIVRIPDYSGNALLSHMSYFPIINNP